MLGLGRIVDTDGLPRWLSDKESTCNMDWEGPLEKGVWLECDPDIPVAPGEEHYVLDPSLDEDSLP